MKYEYKIIHQVNMKPGNFLGTKFPLEELGKEGWELVCYWPDEYSFIFKRPYHPNKE